MGFFAHEWHAVACELYFFAMLCTRSYPDVTVSYDRESYFSRDSEDCLYWTDAERGEDVGAVPYECLDGLLYVTGDVEIARSLRVNMSSSRCPYSHTIIDTCWYIECFVDVLLD